MQKSSKTYNTYTRSVLLGALMGVSLAVVFAAGFFLRDLIGLPSAFASSVAASDNSGYPLLNEVQALLDQNYLRSQPEFTARQYAAIRGVLNSLEDRYTFFIDPPVAQSESDVLAGTYGGIGVLLQRSETGDFLLFPFPDSPAIAAGVEDGDILRAINGVPIELSQQQDAVDQMLRGEVKDGSGVELTVSKPARDKEVTIFVPFAVINVPSVVWRVLSEDSRLGYIQILRFTNRTPAELTSAIQELRNTDIGGLILDLRNNSGGLLQESVTVASQFLKDGVVVYEKSKTSERVFDVEPGGLATDWPLVVLINQGTASAAELVAGAIQDYQRGTLIGQTTYGKGTVQQIFRLSDQSSVHITSAEFFTPGRNILDGKGITPTIAMIPDQNGRDVEIGEAIRTLQQQLKEAS
jgi:carboxyl-terminal processing protease